MEEETTFCPVCKAKVIHLDTEVVITTDIDLYWCPECKKAFSITKGTSITTWAKSVERQNPKDIEELREVYEQ